MTHLILQNSAGRHELRKFGLVMATFFGGVFGTIVPLITAQSVPVWPWTVAVVFVVFSLARPISLSLAYRLWMSFGEVMGGIMSRLILGILFALMMTPIGLMRRLAGSRSFFVKPDPSLKSYRSVRDTPYDPKTMERPY